MKDLGENITFLLVALLVFIAWFLNWLRRGK